MLPEDKTHTAEEADNTKTIALEQSATTTTTTKSLADGGKSSAPKKNGAEGGASDGEGDSDAASSSTHATNGSKRKLPAWMMGESSPGDSEEEEDTARKRAKPNGAQEAAEAAPEASESSAEAEADVKVKQEPEEQAGEEEGDEEPKPSCSGTTNPVDIKPAVKVEKADASSTSRESCKFGIRCYRRNPMHRIEEAHPGDHDYRRPKFPAPPDGTPDCPYGNCCYRRNPAHFQQYKHPENTDFEQNYRNYRMRLRQRRGQQLSPNDGTTSDQDEYDLEDPFIDDADTDSDYVPSADEADGETEEIDYDDCDRVEE